MIFRRRLAPGASRLPRAGIENVYYLACLAAFQENDKGSIEVGKLADFTVLSRDIMKIPDRKFSRRMLR
jgi:hypothetical protein